MEIIKTTHIAILSHQSLICLKHLEVADTFCSENNPETMKYELIWEGRLLVKNFKKLIVWFIVTQSQKNH